MTDVAQIGGLRELWAQTLGDPRICIAILDGPVDLNHPSLREAAIMQINLDEVSDSGVSPHSDHGTHVTSVIFGSHHGPVKGIAPNCRGLIVPIFRYDANGALEPCSQERLAKAIRVAVRFGANVINISGGQFSTRGEASPELLAAIKECGEDVLIVAAAGNDGCDCLHVPGALPSVLAVGAMDAAGRPLPFSNWGEAYREQGILAPGERILGAAGDGGVKAQSGTSFSTPIVSGVAGLLLSLQQKLGIVPSATSIRNAILESTHGCDPQTETQCERVLAGRLNVSGSISVVTRGANMMPNAMNSANPTDVVASHSDAARSPAAVSNLVGASSCCGGCAGQGQQFVYAIGELHYDFPSVLREQSVQQNMAPIEAIPKHVPQARHGLDFLRHLFGFTEVRILDDMEIGDIDAIEVKSSIYALTIAVSAGTFRLSHGTKTTVDIPHNATAAAIREALKNLPGLSESDIRVIENIAPGNNHRDLAIEFQPHAISGVLRVSSDPNKIATVQSIGQLRVTVSDGELKAHDVGRQIGFNGVSVGQDEFRQPSVLNHSNSMIIRHVHGIDASGQQLIFVSTDSLDASDDLSLNEAHFYVPRRCRVTNEHRSNMYDASAVIWKLNRGQMEVYGIVPDGNFAEDAYRELAEFHMNQRGLTKSGLNYYYYEKAGRLLQWEFGWAPTFNHRRPSTAPSTSSGTASGCAEPLVQEKSERVAIPGVLQGEVQLITGVRLPAIKPDMRGTAEWSQARMLEVLLSAVRHATGIQMSEADRKQVKSKIRSILERLDHAVRNPGLNPEHRALNHASTRLFSVLGAVAAELIANEKADIGKAAKTYELDDIVVKPSEIGYAGSDCWDVEVSFFNPENQHEALVVVSQTIDVNDTIPALTDKPRKFRRR